MGRCGPEALGEMFEGDFADKCTENISAGVFGGQAEGLACTDLGARTPIATSENLILLSLLLYVPLI